MIFSNISMFFILVSPQYVIVGPTKISVKAGCKLKKVGSTVLSWKALV